jgi:hypothetical protein
MLKAIGCQQYWVEIVWPPNGRWYVVVIHEEVAIP